MIGEKDTRPWGTWMVLDEGDGFKVKRITVDPMQRLSYQTHEHRAEHWAVVSGRDTATSVISTRANVWLVVTLVSTCIVPDGHSIISESTVLVELKPNSAETGDRDERDLDLMLSLCEGRDILTSGITHLISPGGFHVGHDYRPY